MIESILIGTFLGILAGFTPGLHSNTFAVLLVSSDVLFDYFEPRELVLMIIASAVAYTVADILPTTFLGVPDEETAIGLLPAHSMVLEGRGIEAVSISTVSSLVSAIISLPLLVTVLAMSNHYLTLKMLTPAVLVMVAAFLIMSERADEFEGKLRFMAEETLCVCCFCLQRLYWLCCLKQC